MKRKGLSITAAVAWLILAMSQFCLADSITSWGPWNTDLYTAAAGQNTNMPTKNFGKPDYLVDRNLELGFNPTLPPNDPPFEPPIAEPPGEPGTDPPVGPPIGGLPGDPPVVGPPVEPPIGGLPGGPGTDPPVGGGPPIRPPLCDDPS